MMHAEDPQFTLVRHSGYAQAADPAYEEALQPWPVDRGQAARVRAAGGMLWPSREAAEAAIPAARGHFSALRIGGAELFIPAGR
jgi:hypothetical protein